MRIKLAENIKSFRKERKMTQEQLAEALGVTVGAVHKWEKDLSTPDLSLIFAMTDLFGISTDVLLGYEWRNGNAGDAIQKIQKHIQEKNFEEAVAESEKAMKKFPNNFEIVYQSAVAYLEWSHTFDMNGGTKDWQEKAHTRGEEVFEHALELLPQNKDPEISRVSLSRQFAEFHEFCMHIYRAIDVLKECNVSGINDAIIGHLYVTYIHEPDKAAEYLAKAYTAVLRDMDMVILAFAEILGHREDYDNALACVEWSRKVIQGIQPEGDLTELDRYNIFLDVSCANICCAAGNADNTKWYLRRALENAIRLDAAAPEDFKAPMINSLMHIADRQHYANIWGGKPVTEWVGQLDLCTDEDRPGFKAIWDEVKAEVLP